MEKQEVENLIKKLEQEINTDKQSPLDVGALDRLREAARVYDGSDKVISSLELAEEIKQRPEEVKIMSGWKGLDEILNGFRLNQLVVFAAPTKSGKTSFSMDLTIKIKDHNPLWFPLEEGADELIVKFIERGEEVPRFFIPKTNTYNSVAWLEEKIIEGIVKYNSKVVFIDHLHFIVPLKKEYGERQDLLIGQAMRELKGIAKKWNVCIVLIAHLKKTELTKQPDLEDLRDSSFVAQEADTVLMLWRQSKRENGEVVTTNNVNISIQANRRTGKTGNIKMVFEDGHFIEKPWEDKVVNDYVANLKKV